MKPPTICPSMGPICTLLLLTATLQILTFGLVGATKGCEGSNWGFLGELNPSRPSPGVQCVPVHVYHVYQVLHPLPHPQILTFDW